MVERLGADNSEVFHFHGRKNKITEPESGNTFAGRKRRSSSSSMSLVRDRMLSEGSESLENSRLVTVSKVILLSCYRANLSIFIVTLSHLICWICVLNLKQTFRREVVGEQLVKSFDDDDIRHSMQLPPRPTSSLLTHQQVSTRPESLISKWERSLPVKPGSTGHSFSRLAQGGIHMGKLSSSCTYKDVIVGATLIPQPAADEGSRTGMKGSGILNIINSSSSGAGEKKSTGPVPYSSRHKAPQIVEPVSSNVLR